MRELELIIDEALRKGLRSEERTPRNTQALVDCSGFRVGKEGLEVAELINYPFPDTLDIYYSWPFPQFLYSNKHRILVVRDDFNMEDIVYSVDSHYDTFTQIFATDELTFGKGGLMELADFGKYAFMTNGVVMFCWNPTVDSWHIVTPSNDIPLMKTVCNFKGQLIGGGIVSDWYDCDETYIIWGKIGEASFTLDKSNEAGFCRDPFGGKVQHVRRLGDDIIVYSSKGITRMFPAQSPATTFGFEEIHNVGIRNQGAVNGSVNEHLFVDKAGCVWRIDRGAKLTYLGYKEYMKDFLTDEDGEYYTDEYGDRAEASPNVIVSYDSSNSDFYLCSDLKGFIKSPNGMTRVCEPMSSIWYDERLLGVKKPKLLENIEYTLVSETFDMGYRGIKTIFSVESGLSGVSEAEVALDWRTDPGTPFRRTDWKPLNNSGIVSIIVSGEEFRLCFRAKPSNTYSFSLDYFKLRWKMTDLRGLRGIYAPPPRGQ